MQATVMNTGYGNINGLGNPIDINAWMYSNLSTCPEFQNWDTFWSVTKKLFVTTMLKESISVECASKEYVTLKRAKLFQIIYG